MNQARVGLLVAAALLAMPVTALAQPKGQPPKAQAGKKVPPAGKAQPPAGAEKEINLDEDPAAAQPADDAAPGEKAGDAEGLDNICKIDPSACPTIDMKAAAERDMHVQMYAVQQIYALRNHRFEVNPFFGITMNDQFVSHNSAGLALNFYVTNVIAVGVSGNFYAGLNSNSAFNFQTSRAARVGEPVTEYAWNANANVSYVPAYGKFAGFSDFIFHWDTFLVAGGGVISTRPIAVIDPDNRTFSYKPKPSGHLGFGLRIFFNRWLAGVFEVSDYLFADELENPKVVDGSSTNATTGKVTQNAQNVATWLAPGTSFTNNVQAQVGLSVFLPFTWEYRLPK